jgi:CheY-like chemotaxis protein
MAAILIVEDDDEIREILAEMLIERGFTVITARNGQEGLEAMRGAPALCVVLLDLMMPVMDGWQLRREMLADPALADIPVVVVSGAADVEDQSAVLKAARVLTKPVKWPMLLASVRDHCHA